MKYFWIVIVGLAFGIFDNAFFELGATNIFLGLIFIAILYAQKRSLLALTFAFTYGLVTDMFTRNLIGLTGLLFVLLTWGWFEISSNVKVNSFVDKMLLPMMYIASAIILFKLRFFKFDFGKLLSTIDIIFIGMIFLYGVVLYFFSVENRKK